MSAKLGRECHSLADDGAQPGACRATFTVDGQRGNQKLMGGGIFTLQADDAHAETYLWEVTSSPPACDFLLTGATQPTARLSLPGPSAYVVQLTVTKGTCSAQSRVDPLGGDPGPPVPPAGRQRSLALRRQAGVGRRPDQGAAGG